MNVRPATHAGLWYSGDAGALKQQLDALILKAQRSANTTTATTATTTFTTTKNGKVPGARVLIGPHAGYTYSGERLAETYNVWDTSKVKRVFLLGPSHHVYFKNCAMLTPFEFYETPLGNLPVDTATIKKLLSTTSSSSISKPLFKVMAEDVDEDEHSFEMHAPFIYHQTVNTSGGNPPKIIPIMISGMDHATQSDLAEALLPFIASEENHFIISSDFCHWGSRFGYTKVLPSNKHTTFNTLEKDLVSLTSMSKLNSGTSIHESVANLDKMALEIATRGSSDMWKQYIKITGNTICGQKPISIVLQLLEKYGRLNYNNKSEAGNTDSINNVFEWIGYSQSNPAKSVRDSSVSYASGYVKL